MEVGKGMTMKIIATTIVLAGCGIMAAGASQDPSVQGDTLVSWSSDYRGVAVIPSEIRHIGESAFSGCKALTAVVFPKSIETIGSFAFSGCERLRDIRIPASVTNIGRSAFHNCQSLTNVVILAKVKTLPDNMCSLCLSLRQVEISEGLVEIGNTAFRGCRSLQAVNMPDSVRRIGQGAFVGCSRLSSVEFPNGIELVDEFTFYGCFDLRWLVFRSMPTKVGVGAFRDCHNLRGYVLSNVSGSGFTLYLVPPGREISKENICGAECLVGNYETVKDALLAVDKMTRAEAKKNVFDGLEQALRIAADGMVDELPDRYYPVGKTDALAANLFRLSELDGVMAIKNFFTHHSSCSVDSGAELVVYLCVQSDIAISVKYNDGALVKLTLSDGLKDLIRRKLKRDNAAVENRVLKWLR